MKKTITIISSLLIVVGMSAQIIPGQNHRGLLKAKNDKITMSGNEALSHLLVNPNPTTKANLKLAPGIVTETLIGTSTYDLQSNACVQNRIIHHDDGSISAGWTMSAQYNTTYLDRGTGYNYYDGSSWGAQPTDRLEISRGGWPSILKMGSGKEASITHNTDNSYINMTHRAVTGNGAWSENIVSSSDSNGVYRDMIWNRSAVGGINGEVIHMIAVTASSNFAGLPFNGLDGALVYYRSQDEGLTWDRKDIQLPSLDTSMFNSMSGDVYAITAQEETVVIGYFDDWGDSFILKSTDNGDNWTRTTFLDFPVDKYVMDDGVDLDGDTVLDQLYSSDNYGAVLLDANGDAHVFYGIMMYADDDLTDASSSWFPGINGIAYWNESFGPDTTPPYVHAGDTSLWYSDMMNDHWIVRAPDLNGDGQVAGVDSAGGYALYYASRASMPNAGITASGEIYLSFSGYTETVDQGTQVFRHIYVTKSSDGGVTWKEPVDVTPHTVWGGAQECVFGSMNPIVDDKIRIIYQKDFEPGLAVRGDEDLVDNNEIIYLEIDTAGLFTSPVVVVTPSWSCNTTTYTCVDPGDGSGTYSDKLSCESACVQPTWNCDQNSGVCADPGNGTGQYISLADCKSNSTCITSIEEVATEISIHPNPTKNVLTVNGEYNLATIYNMFGKLVLSSDYQKRINLSELSHGIYFINLEIGTKVITKKLIITN